MCVYCTIARMFDVKYCRPCWRKLFHNKKKGSQFYLRYPLRIFLGRSTVGRDTVNVAMLVRFQPGEPKDKLIFENESPDCVV